MQRIFMLAALATLAASNQPPAAEWMPASAAYSAADPLPPRDPDAEIIGPITDPRPAVDGNFQIPRGHRLAGVYRNDKPRLPPDYVRYLRDQGLTPEQIEHGAGLEGTRRVRAPALVPAPAPGQVPLPGGLVLHLERDEPEQRPGELHSIVPNIPAASNGPSGSEVDGSAARHNEVGVSATTEVPWPSWTDFPKPAELHGAHPQLEDLRRHHRRLQQKLDEQWERQLQKHERAVRDWQAGGGGGLPRVQEQYHVRQLPGGGRSVSYSKRTTHSTYATSGRPSRRLQRRKRQHQSIRGHRQWRHRW